MSVTENCGGEHNRRDNHRISEDAVVQLHGGRVFKRIAPKRLEGGIGSRREPAVHERPGVVGVTGVQAGHECAENDLEKNRRRQAGRRRRRPIWRRRLLDRPAQARHIQRRPQHGCEKKGGQTQMGGEPIGTDVRAFAEPGGDHKPTECALGPAQRQQGQQSAMKTRRNSLGDPKERQRNCEG